MSILVRNATGRRIKEIKGIEGNKRVFFFRKWKIKMKKRGGSGPVVKLLKRRLDYDGLLFFLTSQLNRDKHRA